jgi:FkbM family methyltransferase
VALGSGLKQLGLRLLPDRFLFELKKRRYARTLPRFAEPETPFVRALVGEGDRVLDVGANVGWYTHLLSARVGTTGHVLSVEPVPETHRLLVALVERRGLQNVTLFQNAVSDRRGTVVMEVPLYEGGGENYYQAHIVSGSAHRNGLRHCEVERTTIDDLSAGLGFQFIKGDVEGHELHVVRGALDTIRRSRPSWLLEVIGDPDAAETPASRVFEFLAEFDYAPYLIRDGRLTRRRSGDRSDNYFFLAEPHVDRLRRSDVPFDP